MNHFIITDGDIQLHTSKKEIPAIHWPSHQLTVPKKYPKIIQVCKTRETTKKREKNNNNNNSNYFCNHHKLLYYSLGAVQNNTFYSQLYLRKEPKGNIWRLKEWFTSGVAYSVRRKYPLPIEPAPCGYTHILWQSWTESNRMNIMTWLLLLIYHKALGPSASGFYASSVG